MGTMRKGWLCGERAGHDQDSSSAGCSRWG